MHFIDLHCDTLYKSVTNNIPIDDVSMELKINNSDNNNRLQCFAIWLPDELTSDEAEKLFFNASKKLTHLTLQRLASSLINNSSILHLSLK